MIKYLLIIIIFLSSVFADGPGNKRWKKGHKKHYRYKKHRTHKVVYHTRPNVKIKYGYHWMVLGSILHGGLGAFGGAVYGILIPIASEQIILEKEGWYISE